MSFERRATVESRIDLPEGCALVISVIDTDGEQATKVQFVRGSGFFADAVRFESVQAAASAMTEAAVALNQWAMR